MMFDSVMTAHHLACSDRLSVTPLQRQAEGRCPWSSVAPAGPNTTWKSLAVRGILLCERKDTMMKTTPAALCFLLLTGCISAPVPAPSAPGTQILSRNVVLHTGPELAASVAYLQGKRAVSEEWLVLGVELTSPTGSGPFDLDRGDISLRTPDGRRLELVANQEYFRNTARLRIPTERTMAFLPVLYLYQPNRQSCSQWFLEAQSLRVALDVINISSTRTCSGPLVFQVPGGVQPGRWRLIFELEESRPDIPFVIEIED
jgi:hypothetical protein